MRLSRRTRDLAGVIGWACCLAGTADAVTVLAPDDDDRTRGLERLATSLLEAGGFDAEGLPLDAPAEDGGVGWNAIDSDLRAVAEERCTPRQLEAMRLRADGHGTREIGRRLGIAAPPAQRLLERAGLHVRFGGVTNSLRGEGRFAEANPDGTITPSSSNLAGSRSPELDPDRLRMLPMQGAGTGVAPGTSPYACNISNQDRRSGIPAPHVRGALLHYLIPDAGIAEVDSRAVLRGRVDGSKIIVTVQNEGESEQDHAARHRRRVRQWNRGRPLQSSLVAR